MSNTLSPRRIRLARAIALAADTIQIVLLPAFVGGAVEGPDAVLEVVVALLLMMLCGFHVAFLPTLVAEALPVVDVFPSWTLATLFVTRRAALQKGSASPG
jgi:ABC-type sulfate transport system permease subunit